MEKRALISVSDKTGVVEFARELVRKHGYTILSTGGTAKLLAKEGIPVTEVSDYTGFPEMMDGRVKTLHPKIHGGLLCLRSNPAHMQQAQEHGIGMIDLVAVNLYPFESTVSKPDCTIADAIENIDIGGPSMLRSAAKNHASVTVVCDSSDYPRVLEALRAGGEQLQELRRQLALKVYQRTSSYDAAIANYLNAKFNNGELPSTLNIGLPLEQKMRYGENPHQSAALYGEFNKIFRQLQGKELSYNNIIDISAAAELIAEFEKPTVAILKHTNPCGVASCDNLVQAWEQAFETDRQAPFGGIIAVNRRMEADLAEIISHIFCEVIIAPDFSDGAIEIFSKKKNLRLMLWNCKKVGGLRVKSVVGGVARANSRRYRGAESQYESCDKAPAHGRRMEGVAVWLESRQARQEQCDCLCGVRTHARNRRGPDVARGQLENCSLEGGRSQALAQAEHCGVRRFLPVCRRIARGSRGGRDRGYPARRLSPRQRSNCGGGRK